MTGPSKRPPMKMRVWRGVEVVEVEVEGACSNAVRAGKGSLKGLLVMMDGAGFCGLEEEEENLHSGGGCPGEHRSGWAF